VAQDLNLRQNRNSFGPDLNPESDVLTLRQKFNASAARWKLVADV
jgi:hypothetical protein